MSESPRVPGPMQRTLLLLVAGLAAALGGAYAARHWFERPSTPATQVAAVYGAPRPLPAFALTAHDGTRYDRARLLGHYTLLLFGYTNCPDVCPTTLLELAHARRALADLPAAQQPAVVMISVDPARDTPAVLARYVPHFDPQFVGATGADAALAPLAAALGAVYEVGTAGDGSYRVDHTAAVFLVDPQAAVAAVFPAPHVAATIAADYRRILAAREGG